MNRARESVRWFFKQTGAIVDVLQKAYDAIGVIFFQPVRIILGQIETLILNILDVIDEAGTGVWNIVRGRR